MVSKHILVVPSIPIKEGTFFSLKETFNTQGLYDNIPYNFFIYDSSRLNEVRDFSTNDGLEIMVINTDAFSKSFKDPSKPNNANIIHVNMVGTNLLTSLRTPNLVSMMNSKLP